MKKSIFYKYDRCYRERKRHGGKDEITTKTNDLYRQIGNSRRYQHICLIGRFILHSCPKCFLRYGGDKKAIIDIISNPNLDKYGRRKKIELFEKIFEYYKKPKKITLSNDNSRVEPSYLHINLEDIAFKMLPRDERIKFLNDMSS